MSRMTGAGLAKQLGRTRDAFGIVEEYTLTIHKSIERELSDDHFSERFFERLDQALKDARESLDECYEAVDDLSGHLLDTDAE